MRKPNNYQQAVLDRIAAGDQRVDGPVDLRPKLEVKSFQYSRDGMGFVAHRTVRKPAEECVGDPRRDYTTQMWRLPPEGVAYRL